MANRSAVLDLHALGAESGAGEGVAVNIGEGRSAAFVSVLTTTGPSGLSIQIQTSRDGTSGWYSVGEPVTTGAGAGVPRSQRVAIDRLQRFVRATWSAAATFEVTARAHQLYADRDDLYAKLSREICAATEQLEPGIIARSLIEATDVAQDDFGLAYTLPMVAVPESIVGAVAAIARLTVLERHGFVGGGIDELAINGAERARQALKDAMRFRATIAETEPEDRDDGWAIESGPSRGW